MKTIVKIFIVVMVLFSTGVIVRLVYAASQGEDFVWLSTSEKGIRIGGAGNEGELPIEDAIEFVNNGASIRFFSDGWVGSAGEMFAAAVGDVVEEELVPKALLILIQDQEGEGDQLSEANLIAIAGTSRMASINPFNQYPVSSVVCTPDGDVLVQLGNSSTGYNLNLMFEGGDQEMSALMSESTLNTSIYRRLLALPWR